MAQRVVVAMSGGVDSSVAAARLVEQGYDVIGVTLHLWDYPDDGSVRGRCCAPEDIFDARRVADKLGIFHYTYDRRALFEREVVAPFVEAYLSGTTPSPCVHCNRGVKVRELFEIAEDLGAAHVATGHYARVDAAHEPPALLRALDHGKDQSYFLHMLPPEVLARLMFPLGTSSKSEVREQALRLGLSGADKGESQELCFVQQGRYAEFVSQRAPERVRPGEIVDEEGRQLGTHAGIHRFTLGQRKNLGVATGERAYVLAVDANSAKVTVGARERLLSRGARLTRASLAPDVVLPITCDVAVRYRGRPERAHVQRLGTEGLEIRFIEPMHAVVPGQVAVLYQGERVLGGGTIDSSITEVAMTDSVMTDSVMTDSVMTDSVMTDSVMRGSPSGDAAGALPVGAPA
jgi:tRNA-uridine 2-sulfurtransferase